MSFSAITFSTQFQNINRSVIKIIGREKLLEMTIDSNFIFEEHIKKLRQKPLVYSKLL